jgi:hypothetical protein
MKSYDTMLEALNDLRERGYTDDFNLKPDFLECHARDLQVHPENFKVDEMYRFEGMSNPDDNSIVFAISSESGIKGVLVDAYGMYAESINEAMRLKLR